jgi:hypothetical protein
MLPNVASSAETRPSATWYVEYTTVALTRLTRQSALYAGLAYPMCCLTYRDEIGHGAW